jgi:predicted acetyltransferase
MLPSMSALTLRPLQGEDRSEFAKVLGVVYNDGRPFEDDSLDEEWRAAYSAHYEGTLVGGLFVLDMVLSRGAARLPCGAIQAVAILPDARGSGLGTALMRESLRAMRDSGKLITALYAFREPFYRKTGYEVCGKRMNIVCPAHRLPNMLSDLPVRRLGPDDWRVFAPCHEAFASARSGVHSRTEPMWKRFLAESTPNTVYCAGDPVEGYVALCHKTAFWVEQAISEVCWTSQRGYEACLSILRLVAINKTAVSWYEPSDSPFLGSYLDQGVEARVSRPAMFRVLDVPGALRALQPAGAGEFRLQVQDSDLPENTGPWHVRFSPSGVEVSPADGADFEIDIKRFTQLFMGEPGVKELVRNGQVPSEAMAVELLLPDTPVILGDFF